jgi:hypothetical protein
LTDTDVALADGGDYDPSVTANWETDLFLAAWEEITDLEGVMFLYEPYVADWFEPVSCYDWNDVTGVNGTFYSDYYFEYGSLGCYEDYVFECVSDEDTCYDTQPGTDATVWEPSTYEANTMDQDAYLALVLPQ